MMFHITRLLLAASVLPSNAMEGRQAGGAKLATFDATQAAAEAVIGHGGSVSSGRLIRSQNEVLSRATQSVSEHPDDVHRRSLDEAISMLDQDPQSFKELPTSKEHASATLAENVPQPASVKESDVPCPKVHVLPKSPESGPRSREVVAAAPTDRDFHIDPIVPPPVIHSQPLNPVPQSIADPHGTPIHASEAPQLQHHPSTVTSPCVKAAVGPGTASIVTAGVGHGAVGSGSGAHSAASDGQAKDSAVARSVQIFGPPDLTHGISELAKSLKAAISEAPGSSTSHASTGSVPSAEQKAVVITGSGAGSGVTGSVPSAKQEASGAGSGVPAGASAQQESATAQQQSKTAQEQSVTAQQQSKTAQQQSKTAEELSKIVQVPRSPVPEGPPATGPPAGSSGLSGALSSGSVANKSNGSVGTTTVPADPGLPKQDCTWYDWSPWSYCSRSCGHGYQSRQRIVGVQAANGGAPCEGSDEEHGSCNDFECTVDCEYAEWGDWSHCTASCDSGARQRRKPIKVQNNSAGRPCDQSDGFQSEDCNTQPCAKGCKWSDWTEWASCTKTCGRGTKKKTREIADPGTLDGAKCQGPATESEDCNQKACPKDCQMADWQQWGACSSSCGNGTQIRRRSILVKEEANGQPCAGGLQEDTTCGAPDCPIDCSWEDWTEWSACSVTCSSSGSTSEYAQSIRKIAVSPLFGGRPCTGEDNRTKRCGEVACPSDCVWHDWEPWKACTKTCGGGISERIRTVAKEAKHGGATCPGAVVDVKPCAVTPCPVDCRLADWGAWSDCTESCGTGNAMRFRFEKTPATKGGKKCTGAKSENRECIGNDCVPTQTLLSSGKVVQITGAVQLVTEDPLGFAANPYSEQVMKAGIVKIAEQPLRRVHVSILPGGSIGQNSHGVDIWFSVLVPVEANITQVIGQLTKGGEDLVNASRILKVLLSHAGIQMNIKITKFMVTKIRRPKPTPPPPNITKNITRSDWDLPNTSRLTGVMKVLLPTRPREFSEDKACGKATESTLADVAGVKTTSVHASLVPDQAITGYTGDPETVEDNHTQLGESGEVDVWFSLVGPPCKTQEEAVQRGKEMCEEMKRQDLGHVTQLLGDHLVNCPAPKCMAKTGTVTFLMCKVEGAYDETLEDDTPAKRITGVMDLEVEKPREFSADHRSEEAAKLVISQLAEVDLDRIQVAVAPEKAEHEIEILKNVQGPPKIVEVEPNSTKEDGDKCYAWFVILVPARPANEDLKLVSKLRGLAGDLPLIELKYQNNLMNAGMDSIARVTQFYVDGYKGVSSAGGPKAVSAAPQSGGTPFGADSLSTSVEPAETTTGTPCAQNSNGLGNAVVTDGAAPPSEVVAVVAKTEPESLIPPTMANPGGGDEDEQEQQAAANEAAPHPAPSLLESEQEVLKAAALRYSLPWALLAAVALGLV